jgi:protein SMG7
MGRLWLRWRFVSYIISTKLRFNLSPQNSPLLLINNHIVFNPEAVEEVRVASHPEVNSGHSVADANVPIHQQQLLATIRDNSLDLHPKRDPDADDMTELTSRTDDDPVRDAFKFLNTSEDIVDDDEEDEIVWDPRFVVLVSF